MGLRDRPGLTFRRPPKPGRPDGGRQSMHRRGASAGLVSQHDGPRRSSSRWDRPSSRSRGRRKPGRTMTSRPVPRSLGPPPCSRGFDRRSRTGRRATRRRGPGPKRIFKGGARVGRAMASAFPEDRRWSIERRRGVDEGCTVLEICPVGGKPTCATDVQNILEPTLWIFPDARALAPPFSGRIVQPSV